MTIDKNTLIPLGFVLTILGGMFWLGKVVHQVEAHEQRFVEFRSQQVSNDKHFESILDSLARIETRLQIKGK